MAMTALDRYEQSAKRVADACHIGFIVWLVFTAYTLGRFQ
jgi:hypothetical protein